MLFSLLKGNTVCFSEDSFPGVEGYRELKFNKLKCVPGIIQTKVGIRTATHLPARSRSPTICRLETANEQHIAHLRA